MTDVLVVGGGPAGASAAFQLARRGARVRVLERATFPRAKPCAECLSPQASRLLADMGVIGALEPRGALLQGMMVRAPNGAVARGDYAASHGYRGFSDTGLAIRRELLDTALLDAARAAGADVVNDARVTDVLRDERGDVVGVRCLTRDGRSREERAPVVIGADGLQSVVSRRLGLARRQSWPKRFALVAHYEDVRGCGTHVEMHVETDGFVGVADVGEGVTTVAAVFPTRRAADLAGDATAFLDRWIASKPQLRDRFARATRLHDALAAGPFASHARRAWHPGALLVGDAADFFDPFTGEGIYAALRGGEMVADAAVAAMGASDRAGVVAAHRHYDGDRHAEFSGKWRVERLIGAGVVFPFVTNRAIARLRASKPMADLLVGVTGDFVPPARVLAVGYLARLFLAPLPA